MDYKTLIGNIVLTQKFGSKILLRVIFLFIILVPIFTFLTILFTIILCLKPIFSANNYAKVLFLGKAIWYNCIINLLKKM